MINYDCSFISLRGICLVRSLGSIANVPWPLFCTLAVVVVAVVVVVIVIVVILPCPSFS